MTESVARNRNSRTCAVHGSDASVDDNRQVSAPRIGGDGRILEGIVTTLDVDGTVHFSPLGPIVGKDFDRLVLRPFCTSTTYANLRRVGCGVFHVVDDALLIARSAIGRLDQLPATRQAPELDAEIILDACRWFAFRIGDVKVSDDRAEIVADVVQRGEQRPFFGFNRAKHAVVEAAILATRVHLLDAAFLSAEFRRLESPLRKTGGAEELEAFRLLVDFVRQRLGAAFEVRAHHEMESSP